MMHLQKLFKSPAAMAFVTICSLTAGLVGLPLALAAQETAPGPSDSIPPLLWQLTAFEDIAGGATPVDDPARYTIQFLPDGRAAIGADCNRGDNPFDIYVLTIAPSPGVAPSPTS